MAASGPRKQEENSWWSKDTAPGDHDPDNDLDRKFDMSKDVASGGAMCEKGRCCGPTLNGTFIIEEMNGTRHNDDGSMARANGATPLCNSVKIMNHSHPRQAVNILNGFKDPSFLLDTEFPSGLLELSVESPMPGLGTYSGIWAEKLCSDNLTSTSSLTGTPNVNASPWRGAERRLAGCDADFAFQEMMLLRGSNGDSRHVSEILDGDESKKRDQVGKCPDKLKEFRSIDGLGMVESIADEGGIDNGIDNQGSENSEGADNGDDFIDKCANVAGNKDALQPNPLRTASDDTDDDACDSDSRGNGLMENNNRLGEWSEGSNITSEINAHATVLLSDSESHSGSKSDNVNNYSDKLILMDDCTTTKESLKNCTELPKMPFETDASTTQHLRHGEKDDDKEEHEYEELASKLLLVLDDRDHPKANGNDTNIIESNNIGSTCDNSCKDNGSDDGDYNPHIPAVENSLCETHQAPCEEDGSCIHSSGQNDGLACNVQDHNDNNNFSCPDRDDSELLPPSRENGALKELMCDGDTWSKLDLALPSERAAELTPDVTPAKSSRFFSGLELCTSTPLMFNMTVTTATPLPGPRSRFGFRAPAVTSSKSRGSSVAIPATNLNSTRPGTNLNRTKSIGTNLNCTKSTVTNLNSTKSTVTNLNSTKSTGTNLNSTRPNSYNLNSTRPTSTNLNNTTTATATNLNNTRSIGTNGMVRHLAKPPSYASKLLGPGGSSFAVPKPSSSSSHLARPPLATTKLAKPCLSKLAKSSLRGPQLPGKAEVGGVDESSLLLSKAALSQSIVVTTSGKDSGKPSEIGSSQTQPSLCITKPVSIKMRQERTESSQMPKPERVEASNSAQAGRDAVGPRKLASLRAAGPGHPRPKLHPVGLRTPSTRLMESKGEGMATQETPGVTGRRGHGGVSATPEPARLSVKVSRLAKPSSTNPTKLARPNLNVSEKTKPNYSSARLTGLKTPLVRLSGLYSNVLKLDKTNLSISKLTKPVLNVSKLSQSSSIVSKPTKSNMPRVALARPNANTSKLEGTNSSISKSSRPETSISRFTRYDLNGYKFGKPDSSISKLTGPAESNGSKHLRPNSDIAKPVRSNSNMTSIARPNPNSCKVARPNSSLYKHPVADSRGSRLARVNTQISKLDLGMGTDSEVALLREQLSGALRACQALAVVVQYLQASASA
ncbi:uncharacterized protein LOC133347786 [Lethenteron reissneri]|uniref:uncharacterized protein LOC133347786 n=1 Tax=Lethenteron reissneri TaxID=7753 RepID=UPI002AB6BC99|nr:uncharacterized protein LOC133347786 [Lethenteron reissneri]